MISGKYVERVPYFKCNSRIFPSGYKAMCQTKTPSLPAVDCLAVLWRTVAWQAGCHSRFTQARPRTVHRPRNLISPDVWEVIPRAPTLCRKTSSTHATAGDNEDGGLGDRKEDLWFLCPYLGLCCQFLIQRGSGCGYKKYSTFEGSGDDIERNPIASGTSIGKGGGC